MVDGVEGEKGEKDFAPKRTIHGAWLKENRAEVFLSTSERSAGLRNIKTLPCSLDCHHRLSDIKGKAEFLQLALADNTLTLA